MKNTIKYALFGAVLAATPAFADAPDCQNVSAVVKRAVAAQPDKVLELVAAQIGQNEACACEIVKAAIVASDADKAMVASIVDAAATAAPSKLRIIGQCAVAVAPDALAQVNAVVTKLTAVGGDSGYSAKGGDEKGGKPVVVPPVAQNPLDFPNGGTADNPVGPTPGGPGGFPLLPPVDTPPTVTPSSSTAEDVVENPET
ncbi:hypothetical protein HW115_17670 [Verrucomicrobiaceae bacterium N1E253]|uniref:Uncharacterized protein n=1 Tax=Oceaniferula marina TaxID=2748318 RepID=A0A851GKA8_9BACT|nr:hypothetical protein [Oceaniferula marina]NWK57452.1 hypothetical protein [Oceaniferula marina]